MITSEQARRICDRNFGVGGDGVRRAAYRAFPNVFLQHHASWYAYVFASKPLYLF